MVVSAFGCFGGLSDYGYGSTAADLAYNKGVELQKQGLHGQAIQDYDKAIQLDPANGMVYYNRGLAYLASQQGKTLGVIGTGNIGSRVARLASAIGMKVIAWTFHPSPQRARSLGVDFVGLDELLRQSDAVTIQVRLSDDSRSMLGARELGLRKAGALLVTAGRGELVDTNALIDALNSGHLGGAGLDVFDQEPLPPGHPLLACEQVVLTPHIADQTPEGLERLNEGCISNAIAFLEGHPQNVANP